jgi:hypothetical protein
MECHHNQPALPGIVIASKKTGLIKEKKLREFVYGS